MRMMEAREREVGRDAGNARESEARAEVARTREGDVVVLRLGKTSVRVNREHFDKLRALYEMSRGGVDEGAFLRAAYAVVARYDAAQGGQFRFAGGHHTALHGEVFDVLRDAFGVSCELFASPLNCRWPRYCSRYFDVDGPFGSLGDYSRFRPSREIRGESAFDERLSSPGEPFGVVPRVRVGRAHVRRHHPVLGESPVLGNHGAIDVLFARRGHRRARARVLRGRATSQGVQVQTRDERHERHIPANAARERDERGDG